MTNHLVIMAGGIGSRFWPMSTSQCPKQFLDITGTGRTMIQQTFDRFESIIDMNHVWVVTSESFRSLVSEQLTGILPRHILLEPCMRNTAPCIAYVSWKILKEDPEAEIVVAPSDHLVLNVAEFQKAEKRRKTPRFCSQYGARRKILCKRFSTKSRISRFQCA